MHIDILHAYILRSEEIKQEEPDVEDLPANRTQSQPVNPTQSQPVKPSESGPAITNDEAVDPIEYSANMNKINSPKVTII